MLTFICTDLTQSLAETRLLVGVGAFQVTNELARESPKFVSPPTLISPNCSYHLYIEISLIDVLVLFILIHRNTLCTSLMALQKLIDHLKSCCSNWCPVSASVGCSSSRKYLKCVHTLPTEDWSRGLAQS